MKATRSAVARTTERQPTKGKVYARALRLLCGVGGSAGVGLLFAAMVATPSWSQEAREVKACSGPNVAPNTLLNAATIDSLKDKCIDGKRIGDGIPERVEWAIRNYGFRMHLIPNSITPEENIPYRMLEATKKYSAGVKLDPATRVVLNYKAGIPFPNIDLNDPEAGTKIIWNYKYGRKTDQFGNSGDYTGPNFVYALVDAKLGVERVQRWNFSRIFMTGRITGGPTSLGDGDVFHKSLLFATYPQDIKGVGTFTISYNSPKFDDTWAYVRAVRRIRRLSGSAWVDPIGGTDQLFDDLQGVNAHPAWYDSFKLLGKTWAFTVPDSQRGITPKSAIHSWQPGKTTAKEEFPRLVSEEWPHWNWDDVWMLRPVYIVEGIPPAYHPYGRKILYYDADNLNVSYVLAYDKKGDFWKLSTYVQRAYDTTDGFIDPRTGKPEVWLFEAGGYFHDYQRMHSTTFHIGDFNVNMKDVDPSSWTLTTLETVGR